MKEGQSKGWQYYYKYLFCKIIQVNKSLSGYVQSIPKPLVQN